MKKEKVREEVGRVSELLPVRLCTVRKRFFCSMFPSLLVVQNEKKKREKKSVGRGTSRTIITSAVPL